MQVAQGLLDHTSSVLGTSQHLKRHTFKDLLFLYGITTSEADVKGAIILLHIVLSSFVIKLLDKQAVCHDSACMEHYHQNCPLDNAVSSQFMCISQLYSVQERKQLQRKALLCCFLAKSSTSLLGLPVELLSTS